MAGSISLSMSQQFDENGSPLSGGLLYFIQAGTTSTPQNAYQDSDLTIAHPNPITLDAAGRVPQFYLADGSIKIRLTDSAGVQQIVADNILVVGPSSGSGGGGSVDATTVFATGDVKARYSTGTLSGWVRLNGRTIGSSTSGASERANADAQALFEYLWGADSGLTVSGGRGGSANADWVANKTIALPDARTRALIGLADMGATASTLFDSATFTSGAPTQLGSTVGAATKAILQANLPASSYSLAGTTDPVSVQSSQSNVPFNISNTGSGQGSGGVNNMPYFAGSVTIGKIDSTGSFTPRGTIGPLGSGTVLQTSSPFLFITIYIKL